MPDLKLWARNLAISAAGYFGGGVISKTYFCGWMAGVLSVAVMYLLDGVFPRE